MIRYMNISIYLSTFLLIFLSLACSINLIKIANAQLTSGVSLNLDVLEVLDPSIGVPKTLLMPSPNMQNRRIILRPPPGVTPINLNLKRIVLKPPPSLPAKVTVAPKITIPLPEKPASKPPLKVLNTENRPTPKNTKLGEKVKDSIVQRNISPTQNNDNVKKNSDTSLKKEPSSKIIKKEKSIAAIPPRQTQPDRVSINFPDNSTELAKDAITKLSPLSEELVKFQAIKIKLLAYASSSEESSSSVRRRSLSRALSVRQFLIDNGVKNTRIEVRALGSSKAEGQDPDRVDIVLNRP